MRSPLHIIALDFINGGITKEQAAATRLERMDANIALLRPLTCTAVAVFAALFIGTFHMESIQAWRMLYLYGALSSGVCAALCFALKRDARFDWTQPVGIAFALAMMAFGVILGVSEPQDPSCESLVAFLLVAPLLIITRPVNMALVDVVCIAIYALLVQGKMSENDIALNLVSLAAFAFVGCFIGTSVVCNRTRSLVMAKTISTMTFTDSLTGVGNHRAFAREVEALERGRDRGQGGNRGQGGEHAQGDVCDLAVLSIDVNDLKIVNDTLTHAAGDELLRGAATCIRDALGSGSSVFRVGGDEFAALAVKPRSEVEEAVALLRRLSAQWKGTLVDGLSLAVGIAYQADHPEAHIPELQNLADVAMYEDKRRYHTDCANRAARSAR